MKTMFAAQRLGMGDKLGHRMKGIFAPHIMTRQEASQDFGSGSVPRSTSLNYSPVTIHHRRGHLLCAFAWWAEQGRIEANPVEKIKRPNVVSGEPGILPVADMERLFRANEKEDPGICGILALGDLAAMRTSDIWRFDFEELDFGQRGFLTPACKTKKRRRQLLHRRAEAFKRAGLPIEADDIAYGNRKREARGEPLVTWQPAHPPKNCLRHSFATHHVALHPVTLNLSGSFTTSNSSTTFGLFGD